jgi:hypothetical protein
MVSEFSSVLLSAWEIRLPASRIDRRATILVNVPYCLSTFLVAFMLNVILIQNAIFSLNSDDEFYRLPQLNATVHWLMFGIVSAPSRGLTRRLS